MVAAGGRYDLLLHECWSQEQQQGAQEPRSSSQEPRSHAPAPGGVGVSFNVDKAVDLLGAVVLAVQQVRSCVEGGACACVHAKRA